MDYCWCIRPSQVGPEVWLLSSDGQLFMLQGALVNRAPVVQLYLERGGGTELNPIRTQCNGDTLGGLILDMDRLYIRNQAINFRRYNIDELRTVRACAASLQIWDITVQYDQEIQRRENEQRREQQREQTEVWLTTPDGELFVFPANLLPQSTVLPREVAQGRGTQVNPIEVDCNVNVVGAMISDLERLITQGRSINTDRYEFDTLILLEVCSRSLGIDLLSHAYNRALQIRRGERRPPQPAPQPAPAPGVPPVPPVQEVTREQALAALGLGPGATATQILGVPVGADRTAIRRAYHRLALRWHPDRNRDPRATEVAKVINEAYEALL